MHAAMPPLALLAVALQLSVGWRPILPVVSGRLVRTLSAHDGGACSGVAAAGHQCVAPRFSCRKVDASGSGRGCWVASSTGKPVFLMDLPSPTRLRELAGPVELPRFIMCGDNSTLFEASHDEARWSGYSLSIARAPSRDEVLVERPRNADRVIELARLWGPLHFVSVTTDVAMAHANLLRSAAYADPVLPGGHRWALVDSKRSRLRGITAAYNAVRSSRLAGNASGYWEGATGPNDIVVFLHDDVHLLPNFELSIYEQVHRLNATDPDTWCGIAMAGAVADKEFGFRRLAGQWLDFGMMPLNNPVTGSAVDAQMMPDEAMLVTLRGGVGQFTPGLSGFHCYGADFGLSCLAKGKVMHPTDTFIASHKSWMRDGRLVNMTEMDPIWRRDMDIAALARAGSFVAETWKHKVDLRQVRTTACLLDKSNLPWLTAGQGG